MHSWSKLREKWHKVNFFNIAFDKKMPLGQWHKISLNFLITAALEEN